MYDCSLVRKISPHHLLAVLVDTERIFDISFMVLYRKYRPQSLAELDLATIRDRLIKTLTSSYVPHALLFAGPRGTGKTSAARIVAKILNCEKNDRTTKNHHGQKYEPCNKCEVCKSITRGNHMDILEIDAASNRGIEEIRDLREKIKLARPLQFSKLKN